MLKSRCLENIQNFTVSQIMVYLTSTFPLLPTYNMRRMAKELNRKGVGERERKGWGGGKKSQNYRQRHVFSSRLWWGHKGSPVHYPVFSFCRSGYWGQKICQQLDWESMFSLYKLMTFLQKFRLGSKMWKEWIWEEFLEWIWLKYIVWKN